MLIAHGGLCNNRHILNLFWQSHANNALMPGQQRPCKPFLAKQLFPITTPMSVEALTEPVIVGAAP